MYYWIIYKIKSKENINLSSKSSYMLKSWLKLEEYLKDNMVQNKHWSRLFKAVKHTIFHRPLQLKYQDLTDWKNCNSLIWFALMTASSKKNSWISSFCCKASNFNLSSWTKSLQQRDSRRSTKESNTTQPLKRIMQAHLSQTQKGKLSVGER